MGKSSSPSGRERNDVLRAGINSKIHKCTNRCYEWICKETNIEILWDNQSGGGEKAKS